MSASIKIFKTKKGKEVKYLSIPRGGGYAFDVKIGLVKARAVLENAKDVEFLLSQVGC